MTSRSILITALVVSLGAAGIAAHVGRHGPPAARVLAGHAPARPPPTAVPLARPALPLPLPELAAVEARPQPRALLVPPPPAAREAALSPFVTDAADHFAFGAVDATEAERAQANAAAEAAEAAIAKITDQVTRGELGKAEAVPQLEQVRQEQNRALVRIFGLDRARVLKDVEIVGGVESESDDVDDVEPPAPDPK